MNKTLVDIMGYQPIKIARDHDEEIMYVMKHRTDGTIETDRTPRLMAYKVFLLGYLAGIRAERSKKCAHTTSKKLMRADQEGRCQI